MCKVPKGTKREEFGSRQELIQIGAVMLDEEYKTVDTFMMVNEMYSRGLKFLPVDLFKSEAFAFKPEDGKIRMPFTALAGLGEKAAEKIVEVRNSENLLSIEELQIKAGLSKSVIDLLRKNGAFGDLTETSQLSFF